MKKLIPLALALILTLALSTNVAAADDIPDTVASLGGTVGAVNVLLGDACIAFTDAAPELVNGRTMVPLRAALEAMGATVDYDAATRTATVTGERAQFIHRIGSDTILLADGTAVTMDTASYLTPTGRTMVPVRFFSQVLGYDVFWDGELRMVFLLDGADYAARVDAQCGVLNGYLAGSALRFDAGKNYRETLALTGTLTTTADDGTTQREKISATLSALFGKDGANLTLRAALGELGTLFADAFGGEHGARYGEALTNFELDALYTDRLYVRSPLLDAFAVGVGAGDGAWYASGDTDYSTLGAALLTAPETFTVGSLTYALATQGTTDRFYESYRALRALETTVPTLLGDAAFTRSGSSYTRMLDLTDLAALMSALTGEEHTAETLTAAGCTDLALRVRVYTDTRASLDLALTLSPNAATALDLAWTLNAGRRETRVSGSATLRDVFTADYSGTVTLRETDETLTLVPPADEKLLTLTGR